MAKLIPKKQPIKQDTINVEEERKKLLDYLNKHFNDNINKINANTPKKLSEQDDSKRPQAPGGSTRNIRGVIRTSKNGTKFFK